MNTPKPLTPEEALLVGLATKGESYAHRRWPGEVIRAFAAAEVATGAGRRAHGSALAQRLRVWFRAGSAGQNGRNRNRLLNTCEITPETK